MAMDGCFSIEFALRRFLARCPELGRISRLDSLVEKGQVVTENEVVSSVAELFLHERYTIPLIGCFRPIARRIVDKAVALLKLVPNLSSNSDDGAAESGYFEDEEVNVIAFHVQRGRGLDLHDLACLAFCRALDLAPFLLGSVLTYFKSGPPPFQRILIEGASSELSENVIRQYLHAMQTSYRLLVLESNTFSNLWRLHILDPVEKSINRDWGSDAKVKDTIADIRWFAMQIKSVILKMSIGDVARFGLRDEEAFSCLLRWEEFCQDVAVEKAGAYIGSSEQMRLDSVNGVLDFDQENCLQSSSLDSYTLSRFYDTEPPMRSRRLVEWGGESASNPFIRTSTVKKSFEMVQLAMSQKLPVLLYGPAGAGKSALINEVAKDSGNPVLCIQMDDQMDAKTLVGTYVCTEQPGEFRWQPGSLTQAVLNGFWVVFEDIDKAPADVLSTLLPLLEGSSSFISGYGEEIRVAENFRIFSTSCSNVSCGIEGRNLSGTLWRKVMIAAPTNLDMMGIVKAWYPSLEPLAGKLVETFEMVNNIFLHQCVCFHSGSSGAFSSVCRFSLRDLLKWCKRIAGLDYGSSFDGFSANEHHHIYQEAVEVFASFSPSVENRLTIMKGLAKMWAIPVSRAETLYPHNEPIIQDLLSELRIGRVTLQRTEATVSDEKRPFVKIRSSLHMLERIACSIKHNEPILLVGETGTGKTTLVQHLAMKLGQRLTVLNLSQQSDAADLLGGFKPTNKRAIFIPIYNEFIHLFSEKVHTEVKKRDEFFAMLHKLLSKENWKELLKIFNHTVNRAKNFLEERSGSAKKRKKPKSLRDLETFCARMETVRRHIASPGMAFSFVEGAFVNSLKSGRWILLDEVNLAPPEVLQRLTGVLEGENGSLCLSERGDTSYIYRHPNFRIFACMNPATDAGKRELPYVLRSRFTEYFVDDVMDDQDLDLFIQGFKGESGSTDLTEKIRFFYKAAKKDSEERLQDGANQKPQFSLRSLYRALEYTSKAERKYKFENAIYDGFCMFFVTLLDRPSAKTMKQRILHFLLKGAKPSGIPFSEYLVEVDRESMATNEFLQGYILTKSVKKHLRNLSRAIFIKKYPVLLQGPTSSGKTSLVQYLATITGHEFVRINNHEHTELQEYLGTYITDPLTGELKFHEGVLVKAVRNGHWIVLDELNLAPSDVLEALNRLLDDNRELFVPELQQTVKAHPKFMLFATQNPPNFYGGRKILSRAFRNRFVEIHVDEIPEDELSSIVMQRCQIPESYSKKMVEVMKELQLHRQKSKVFAGKHGFITPRDLFRWANRFRDSGKSYEDLARDGYHLLAERLRDEDEKCIVQDVLEKHLRVKLVKDDIYEVPSVAVPFLESHKKSGVSDGLGNVILTKSMLRLFFLVNRCFELKEPVLLVGETGGGKTTVCQLLSIVLGLNLHILNCHQYTETSDFLGGFYPVRDRSKLLSEFEQLKLRALNHLPQGTDISSDISDVSKTLDLLDMIIKKNRASPDVTARLEQMKLEFVRLHQTWKQIFVWQDGPLVKAMKAGELFLIDEISLADDSVLERLNSVLEPERKLSLPEKGGADLEKITAESNFFVLATMNPGGDYGKKELSPALRNRFTEIWVPPVSDLGELKSIALHRLSSSIVVDPMINYWEWFNQLQIGRVLTVRDLLSWIEFVNKTERSLDIEYAFLHGAFLVVLDGLSLGTGISKKDCRELRERCLSFLLEQLKVDNMSILYPNISKMENYGWGDLGTTGIIVGSDDMKCENIFGIDPFYIEKGSEQCEVGGFEFFAPTTCRNAMRVLRAMQLPKPVLLEGSPGVGKTSLIVALGQFSGHRVVRINLSEQTDMMDLLGSDLPVETDEGMKFEWSDGILLQALKEGCWVLLDELNLAPQSVLEGLNAILDHRAEVFIPELGRSFRCPSSFRVFACQNPSYQGGGRKGLPKSFLNRFTKVYVDELVQEDYLFICSSLYPMIPRQILSNLILFNRRLHEDTMLYQKFAQDGSPWEFNLRDMLRSCQIIQGTPNKIDGFLNIIYVQRMRTAADRKQVLLLFEEVFGVRPLMNPFPRVQLNSQYFVVGSAAIKRNRIESSKISRSQLKILPGVRQNLEAAAHCVQQKWLCILVGPTSSGKTSLIRLLAHLTGNALIEINLSPSTDISELLGCFEQYNAFRNFHLVVSKVTRFMDEYNSLLLEFSVDVLLNERRDLIDRWLTFLSKVDCNRMSTSPLSCLENWSIVVESLSSLCEVLEQLKLDLENYNLPVSWTSKDLSCTIKTVLKLQDYQRKPCSAKFEWVTGSLLKALESGEWIVLENANLCNPTVLDRINSLVEPGGTITVNECGAIDGKPLIVNPHPNFRMFLTVNPSFGEVSRAMRNRGVEIFMLEPNWIFDGTGQYSHEELEIKDVKQFLVLTGIPCGKLVESMAKAHIHARIEGLRHNVHIRYLELERWVQLFQQLLVTGHQPIWSLKISWEHTYFSSLGDAVGRNIINHANDAYFSVAEWYKCDSSLGSALCLPGGWPMPLSLRDFVWYSKEAYVRQNSLYLEFLGAQYTSHEFGLSYGISHAERAFPESICSRNYILDLNLLYKLMFPHVLNGMISDANKKAVLDLNVANKMLMFAANWTIGQATESDFEMYLQLFSWFSSQLGTYCKFFQNYLTSLQQAKEHPIWTHIIRCRQELISLNQIDFHLHPIPILSLELVDLTTSKDASNASAKILHDAIQSVGLLRLSCQQWSAEGDMHILGGEAQQFKPFLKSLRALEEKVLNMLVVSPSFDVLIHLYDDLLEDHMLFWELLISWQVEWLLICWQCLLKDVRKLGDYCSYAAEVILESKKISLLPFHLEKSLLWVHGGHPFPLPQSAKIYHQQRQLLCLCERIWPTKRESWKQVSPVNEFLIEILVSCDPEVRFLTLEGLCLSSFIIGKCDEEDTIVVKQMEDLNQMLLERFEHEKHKLFIIPVPNESAIFEANSAACCDISSQMLCTRAGFDCWLESVVMVDCASCFLDMELLKQLSLLDFSDSNKLQEGLGHLTHLVESDLKYSVSYSTRPPQSFVPHRKLLWILDASKTVDAANVKVAGFVLEMWFWWHSFLWSHCPTFVTNFSKSDHDIPLPNFILRPVKTASISHILQSALPIKDFSVHLLKLKVASSSVLQFSLSKTNTTKFFLSAARALFGQIIFAHKRSFDADKFAAINAILQSSQKNVTQDDIQLLRSLIISSSHQRVKSLVHLFIEAYRRLYLHSSAESYSSLGFAWLHIGRLRFSLLLSKDGLDPSMKYSSKLSQVEEKIRSLDLESKVQQECVYLAGQFSSNENRTLDTLEKLEAERKKLKRKIVFRPDPAKFKALRKECDDFLERVIHDIDGMDSQQVFDNVCWQRTASAFIDRLSNEYPEYIDITLPVQVAVYEIKLGLSLVLLSAMEKEVLNKIHEDDLTRVMESIYLFMKFPRGMGELVSVSDKSQLSMFSSLDIKSITSFPELDLNFLEKLISLSNGVNSEKVSVLDVNHQILVRVVHFMATAKLMDEGSFKLLEKIFFGFANIWENMKFQGKCKEDSVFQLCKFKPRAFKIDGVIEVDISAFGKLLANDNYMEWQELLSYEEFTEKSEGGEKYESSEEECNLMQESMIISIVNLHNQLFGSTDLVLSPGCFNVSDAEKLQSFVDSYALGVRTIKGLGALFSPSLDTKLVQEHLFRLSIEHEQNFISSDKLASRYNFYKDPNSPLLTKMVKPLTTLRQRVFGLLCEWEDHPGLQKVLDVIEMLFSIPSSTPLAKVLSGLQFLLNRVRILHESGSKFSLSDELEPLVGLVCSWQKLELDSWPVLLDEVHHQFEINAAKLWFPLFLVLHRQHSSDITTHDQSTIESLDEFIRTSSIGEFKFRLQLLFAFLGQIISGTSLKVYSSWQAENLKILYNLFGIYVQYLPMIMEKIEASRKNIETELKEVLKLYRWDRVDSQLSVDNLRRIRQKIRKLIQKYSDILKDPVMGALDQEVANKGLKVLQGPADIFDKNIEMLNAVLDLKQFSDKDRCLWYANWRKTVIEELQNLHPAIFSGLGSEAAAIIRDCLCARSSCLSYPEKWSDLLCSLETICIITKDCADSWKDIKRIGKKTAFSELLKLLESSGLHRHKFENMEISNSDMLLQPSYDAQHLLLTQSRLSCTATNVASAIESQCLMNESLDPEWKIANQFYFKSLVSVRSMQQICLKHHEDFTSEQVNRSISYLRHLIVIQQTQRAALYDLAKKLKSAGEYASALENSYSSSSGFDSSVSSFAQNQHATLKCIWQQKQLFDSLNVMLLEEALLLKTIESSHVNSCQKVKGGASRLLGFIENFIPVVKKSKELLDGHLFGCNESIAALPRTVRPYIVSKQMEQLVHRNFQVVKEFEDQLFAFVEKGCEKSSVTDAVLDHFDGAFQKAKSIADQFKTALELQQDFEYALIAELEAKFDEVFERTYRHIMEMLQKLCLSSENAEHSKMSLGSIAAWESLFKSFVANLRVDELCDELLETIHFSEKLSRHSGKRIGEILKHIHALVDLILRFMNCFLQDFLVIHKTVSMMTHVLANVFGALYAKGFGVSAKALEEDTRKDISQDTKGTGMGEGVGLNDVSEQIDDEDQLIGANEKGSEEQDASNKIPSEKNKGIEMEHDFDADTYSVSADSGDDNNEDTEDEQLESAMGKTGDNSEMVDEKLWDKDEDENPSNIIEKFESGSSVRDNDVNNQEFRAMENLDATEEAEELKTEELAKKEYDEIDGDAHDNENVEDMNLDKEEAYADACGFKLDELNQSSNEDMDMDEKDGIDFREESNPDEQENSNNDGNDGTNSGDEIMEEAETEKIDGISEGDEVDGSSKEDGSGQGQNEDIEKNRTKTRKNSYGPGVSDFISDHFPNAETGMQPKNESQISEERNVAREANSACSSETYNDFTPLKSLPTSDNSNMNVMVADMSNSGKIADNYANPQLPQHEASSLNKMQANPYRNVGDALQEWKERVNVSVDLPEDNRKSQDKIEDEMANEYGYVSEFEKGTAQSLGPATSEQIDTNLNGNKHDESNLAANKDDVIKMGIEDKVSEEFHIKPCASIIRKKLEKQVISEFEKSDNLSEGLNRNGDGDPGSLSECLVSVNMSYLSEYENQLNQLCISDEMGKALDVEDSGDVKSDASALWRKYELLTTRLSQELTEQLRLIMEPTLASKLQGDYKTGKRINMKKVIPYIASHYRKDKIWQRRTRPNKRDYQVVIAIDDSYSMLESGCGDVAIKALVTVCRAMSQLEVGNLAVASFGKKGNIRLLHDFDQPFTGESGIKMISSLTFKQENTIADEPVVDLLTYLKDKLDGAFASSRLPSGQNPLRQLVLIIGDGRLHEKENLKRCVRDVLSIKRMVAFLVLDSQQESIMDLQEVVPIEDKDNRMKFMVSKYLDSFPFPYYVVLRNIESLPKTLADLLRQWFEIMQNSRD